MQKVAPESDLKPGRVVRADGYAVGNNGEPFAVSRICRHLGADLSNGSIDADGCLVCPWHQSKYDVGTGHMVRGPQGFYAKVPGLGATFKALTKVMPLRRRKVVVQDGDVYLAD